MRFTFAVHFFFLLLAILFFPAQGAAQLRGNIRETFSKTQIPFVHITVNEGQHQILSDIDGSFKIPDTIAVRSLKFQTYLHRTVTLSHDQLKKDSVLSIFMNKHQIFELEELTSGAAAEIIENVLKNKNKNSTADLKFASYTTYNKTTFTPEGVDKANVSLEKFLKFLRLKFHTLKPDQHFLIVETVAEKKIYDKHRHKETIEGAQSTILDVPSLFVQTSQLHAFSPYENFVTIAGKPYIGPLANRTQKRYAFSILDTVISSYDTIFVLKYNPLSNKVFDGLKGLLYINSRDYAVQHFTAAPVKEKKLKMYAAQSFLFYPENRVWMPRRSKTVFSLERSGEVFLATMDSYISGVDLNSYLNKKQFDEVILEYPEYATNKDTAFWNSKRPVALTPYDSNTYAYFDSIDQKKFIERTLQFGEHLYYGKLSYSFVDLDLRKFTDVNQHEGLRVGIGGHTNEKLSDRIFIGAYMGYGFKDDGKKFGVDLAYRLRKYPATFKTAFINDVRESGGLTFAFNRFQYSTETLRRIRVSKMDRVIEWENAAEIHPMKYLDLRPAIAISKYTSAYDYQFRNENNNVYYITELRLGIRYAFREQMVKIIHRRVPIVSKYPVVYMQYTKGSKNLFGGEYDYSKYDFKIEYNLKVLDFGKTGIQLISGYAGGVLPYAKLYNGNGSFRPVSVVIHNTFETMQYNEFLSDRYISLFLSHNFGKLYFKSRRIQPSLLLLHNIGFGSLRNPEAHKRIAFKTMEKGYFESGMLLDNVFIFNITSLKIGLGAGFFIRYGPYANPDPGDNFVIKIATNFSL